MASIIGGIGAGTLDSSLYLLSRQDQVGAGTTGAGESVYVNVANGGLALQHTDAWLPSRGDDFLLVRTYNSSGRLTTANKWSLAASLDVAGASATAGVGKIILYNADGSDFTFNKNAGSTNTYTSVDGAGAYQTIVYDAATQTYTLTRPDQTKLTFNSTGLLTKSTDTNGVAITYTYTAGRLTSVQDDTGHTITYGYTGNNLTSLTDATGTVLVTYGYDASNRLNSSTDRAGRTTVYRYNAGGMLIGVDLPTQTDKLLINGGTPGAALPGADAQYYLDWRKRLGVVDANGNGKTAATLTAANITTLRNATATAARSLSFEYTTVAKGVGNDTNALSALVDAMGNRTEFSYSIGVTLDRGTYAGGDTKVISALGVNRMKSNAAEYVAWRLANGYYETWSQANYDTQGTYRFYADLLRDKHATTYTFNANGAITAVKEPTGFTAAYTYDANENLISVMDATGDAITKAGSTLGDSQYYRDLRKSFGVFDPSTNQGKTVAQLSASEIIALKLRFTTTFTYDANGNMLSRTDGEGNKTTFTYTAFNKIATQTAAWGNVLADLDTLAAREKRAALGYPSTLAGLSDAQKTALRAAYTTTYIYSTDGKQNLLEIRSPSGGLTKFSNYDAFGNALTKTVFTDATDLVTAAKQLVTTYVFDAFGNNTRITEPNGSITNMTYDRFGNVLTRTDGRGGVTTLTYDGANRLLTSTDPELNFTYNVYDAVGNRLSVTDASGHFIYSVYDKNNRLIQVKDPSATSASLDHIETLTYDVTGNNTTVTDELGRVTTYVYDESNRLLEVKDPAIVNEWGSTTYSTKYSYDADDHRVGFTDRNGYVTSYQYNGAGLLIQTADAINNVTKYLYDVNLKQISVIVGATLPIAMQRKTLFRFDEADQLIAETDATGVTTSYAYDDAGRKVKVVSALADAAMKSDDPYYLEIRLNMGIGYSGGPMAGQAKLAADLTNNDKALIASKFTTDFTYAFNATGLLVTETSAPVGVGVRAVTKHQFDKNGNEVTTTDANNRATTFTFDKNNRAVMMTDANSIKTVYRYDSRGNRVSVMIGVTAAFNAATGKIDVTSTEGGQVTTHTYNEFNQLTSTVDGVGNALATSDAALYVQMRKDMGYTKVDGTGATVGKLVADLTDADKAALRLAYTTSYVYDKAGRRTRVIDRNGTVTETTYDALDRKLAVTDAFGTVATRKVSYGYDGNGNLTRTTTAVGNMIITAGANYGDAAYYTDFRKRLGYTKLDANGNTVGKAVADLSAGEKQDLLYYFTTENSYDQMNRLSTTYNPGNSNFIVFDYDSFGNLNSRTDGVFSMEEHKTSYIYDLNNRVIGVTKAEGEFVSTQYDALGNRIKVIDGRGNSTRYFYDALSRNIKTIDALDGMTLFEYDAVGNQIKITNAKGGVTQFAFDPGNRMVQITDAENRVTKYTFDSLGNRITQTTAFGVAAEAETTTYEYDVENHLVAVTDAAGKRTTTNYDRDYNRTKVTDANGNTTSYGFDALNRNVTVTDANNRVITYGFDVNNNQVTVTDSRNAVARVTRFAYDVVDRKVLFTDAEGNQTQYGYDLYGRQASITNASAGTSYFTYDKSDRLVEETDAQGRRTEYTYDENSNRTTVKTPRGTLTTYVYDANNRVSKIIDAENNTVEYRYDPNGNRNQVISANAIPLTTVDSAYYKEMRKNLGVVDANGNAVLAANLTPAQKATLIGYCTTTTYYDKTNKVIATVDPRRVVTKFVYDTNGNLKSQTLYAKPLDVPVDPAVVPTPAVRPAEDQTVSFKYDKLNRIIERKDGEGFITKFVYDNVGNKIETHQAIDLAATNFAITRSYYDKLNREAWKISPEGFLTEKRYDAVGNVLTVVLYDTRVPLPAAGAMPVPVASDTWHATSYVFDKNNRVTRESRYVTASSASLVHTDYTYDANGNKLTVTEAAGTTDARTTTYVYDGADRLTDTIDAMGTVTHLVLDSDGNVRYRYEAYGTVNQRRFSMIYDLMGRVVTAVDPLGTRTQSAYDANGNLISQTEAYGTADARTTSFAYDQNSRRISSTNAEGEVTRYTYDGAGNQTSMINANLRAMLTLNDAPGTNGEAPIIDYYRNARKRLGIADNGIGKLAANLTAGDIALITSRSTITYLYDRDNRLVQATDANGVVTKYTYDGTGNKKTATQAVGIAGMQRVTTYEYDKDNRLTKVIDPMTGAAQGITSYEYDILGNQTKIIDANGNVRINTYDMVGRLLTSTYGGATASPTTDLKLTNTYDKRGNILTATQSFANNSGARKTSYKYDLLNRQTDITDGEGFTTTITYDKFGNQTKIVNGRYLLVAGDLGYDAAKAARATNLTTNFFFDTVGRLDYTTDALGNVTDYGYDLVNNRTSMTEAQNQLDGTLRRTTVFVYDKANRVVRTDTPVGGRTFYTYDDLGNKIKESILQGSSQYVIKAGDTWASIATALYGTASAAQSLINIYGPTPVVGTILSQLPSVVTYTVPQTINVAPYYTVKPGDTWRHVAINLYGAVNSPGSPDIEYVAGVLQDMMGDIPAAGEDITGLPPVITREGEEFYQARDENWDDVFDNLYGPVGSTAGYANQESYNLAVAKFQEQMGGGPVPAGEKIPKSEFPASISVTIQVPEPTGELYYKVKAGDSWSSIFRALYKLDPSGENAQHGSAAMANGGSALSQWMSGPTGAAPVVGTVYRPGDFPGSLNVPANVGTVILDVDFLLDESKFLRETKLVPKTITYKPSGFETDLDTWNLGPLPSTKVVQVPATANLILGQTWIINTYEYDSNRNLTAKIDSYGTRTEYTYDAMGNKKKELFAVGTTDERSVQYDYDFNNRKTADIDGLGKRTTYAYDKLGNRIKVTNALGKASRFYYDATNNLTTVLDPEGTINTFKYDAAGNRTEERVYLTKYTGLISETTAPVPTADATIDRVVTVGYDLANRAISRRDADGVTLTTTLYDGSGRKIQETFHANLTAALQRKQYYHYDAAGRLDIFTDVDGTVTSFTYDAANNRKSETITVAAGSLDRNTVRKTVYEYDLNNRRTRETFSDSANVVLADKSITYDLVGNLLTSTNGKLAESFQYDKNNNMVREVQGSGTEALVTSYGYDKVNNKISTTDAVNGVTTLVYDLNNRVVREVRPLTGLYTISGGDANKRPTTVTVYDDAGRAVQTLLTVSDAAGTPDLTTGFKTTRYFDANDRLIGEISAENYLCTYEYNAAGLMTKKSEYMTVLAPTRHNPLAFPPLPAGEVRVTTFEYNLLGKLTKTTLPQIQVTTLAATNTAAPTATTAAAVLTERHTYNAFGDEVETFDRQGNRSVSYYDVNHRKIAMVDALGYLVEWDYDQQGNQIAQRVYTQKVAGTPNVNLLPTPVGTANVTTRWYDAANRLVTEWLPEIEVFNPDTQATSLVRPRTDYLYDAAGNLFRKVMGSGTAQVVTEYSFYNSANRLAAQVDGNRVLTTLDYDSRGNLTKRTRYYGNVPAGTSITVNSTVADLLSAVTVGNINYDMSKNQTTVYEYDAMNRMTKETDTMSIGLGNLDDLAKWYKYDAGGNRTWVKDEDGYVAKNAYDSNAHILQTVTPDGVATVFEYDAAGNVKTVYTGDTATNDAKVPTDISVSLDDNLDFTWKVKAGTVQSWVYWDTAARPNYAVYRKSSNVQMSSGDATISASILPSALGSLGAGAPGSTIYYRIVTQDAAGNRAWSAEKSITFPPRPSAFSMVQQGANLVITATFNAALSTDATFPKLAYGASGTLASSAVFTLKAGTVATYTATITNFSAASTPAYKLVWKDAAGVVYNGAETRFGPTTERGGVVSDVTASSFVNDGVTTYKLNVTTKLPPSLSFGTLQAKWRVSGSSDPFDSATANRGPGGAYALVLGTNGLLAAGSYEIVISGLRGDDEVVLDTFTYTTAAAASLQSLSWPLPSSDASMNDQIVIMNGVTMNATRQDGRLLIDSSVPASGTSDYLVYYGKRFSANAAHKHTLNLTGTMNATGTGAATLYARLTLHSTEASTISGSMYAAITNATGSVITTTPMSITGTTNFEFGFASPANGIVPNGSYQFEIYYTDTSGRKVIVERQRVTVAGAANAAISAGPFTNWSLIVGGQETGTVTRSGSGALEIAPTLYTGPINATALAPSISLTGTDTGNTEGAADTNGLSTGYFVKYQYNALNDKIASNEGDGVWREFGVNANGKIVQTTAFESANGAKIANAASIVTYTDVDARGRTIAQFDGLTVTGKNADGSNVMSRPVTRYTYDVMDRVLTKSDPLTLSGAVPVWTYEYNALGAQTKEIKPGSAETITTRIDQYGNVTAVEGALGHRARKFYDAQGNLLKEIDAAGITTVYTYDLFNRKITQTDGRGVVSTGIAGDFTTSYQYDQRDRLIAIEYAQGWHLANRNEEIYQKERERLGFSSEYSGALGVMIPRGKTVAELSDQEKAALIAFYTTRFKYDGRGNRTVTQVGTGAQNQTTTQVYDAMSRVTETQTSVVNTPSYTRTTTVNATTANGLVTLAIQAELTQGEIQSVFGAAGTPQIFIQYRRIGDAQWSSNSLTRVGTTFNYSRTVTGLLSGTYEIIISYTDSSATQIYVERSMTVDATKATTRNRNSIFGTGSTATQVSKTQTFYDAYGNVIGTTDAAGRKTSSFFGGFGRVMQSTDEDNNTNGFEYDGFGRLKREYSILNQEGKTKNVARTYDNAGHLLQVNDTVTGTYTDYTYTLGGFRLSETLNNAANEHERITTYNYNAVGSMSSWTESMPQAKDSAGRSASLHYWYDAEGNLKSVQTGPGWDKLSLGGGSSTYRYVDNSYNYYDNGMLKDQYDHGTNLLNAYEYDKAGNRSKWTDSTAVGSGGNPPPADTVWTYIFDANNRVAQATATVGTVQYKQTWTYDIRGNVLEQMNYKKTGAADFKLDTGTKSTYDASDRATVTSSYKDGNLDQVTTTGYDLSGRTLTVTFEDYTTTPGFGGNPPTTSVSKTYKYTYSYFGDGREKGVSVVGSTHGESTSEYDGNKQRVKLNLGKGSGMDTAEYSTFTYDNEGHILYKFHEKGTAESDDFADYFYANGKPIGEIGYDGGTKIRFDAPGIDGKPDYSLFSNIGESNPGSNTRYTVRRGDTLQSIAGMLYGNPSLWFVLADANGLDSTKPLPEGQSLKIPNTVRANRLTAENQTTYSESKISGSTLPKLIVPPPKGASNCATIVMVVVIVAIAIVAAVVTAGAGAALAAFAVTAVGATSTLAVAAVTVASFALVGAVVAATASVLQQGIFLAAGFQKKFSWSQFATDAAVGGITGAASGLGSWAKAAATAGKLSSTGSTVVRVSAAALRASGSVVAQLGKDRNGDDIPDGKLTSFAGIAGAALTGYLNASIDIAQGEQAFAGSMNNIVANQAAYQSSLFLQRVSYASQFVTPWVQLAETNIRYELDSDPKNDRLTPSDWAGAAGASLAGAVSLAGSFSENKIVTSNDMGSRLLNSAARFGGNLIIAGAIFGNDADARAKFIADSIGNEVGDFIGYGLVDGFKRLLNAPGKGKSDQIQIMQKAPSGKRYEDGSGKAIGSDFGDMAYDPFANPLVPLRGEDGINYDPFENPLVPLSDNPYVDDDNPYDGDPFDHTIPLSPEEKGLQLQMLIEDYDKNTDMLLLAETSSMAEWIAAKLKNEIYGGPGSKAAQVFYEQASGSDAAPKAHSSLIAKSRLEELNSIGGYTSSDFYLTGESTEKAAAAASNATSTKEATDPDSELPFLMSKDVGVVSKHSAFRQEGDFSNLSDKDGWFSNKDGRKIRSPFSRAALEDTKTKNSFKELYNVMGNVHFWEPITYTKTLVAPSYMSEDKNIRTWGIEFNALLHGMGKLELYSTRSPNHPGSSSLEAPRSIDIYAHTQGKIGFEYAQARISDERIGTLKGNVGSEAQAVIEGGLRVNSEGIYLNGQAEAVLLKLHGEATSRQVPAGPVKLALTVKGDANIGGVGYAAGIGARTNKSGGVNYFVEVGATPVVGGRIRLGVDVTPNEPWIYQQSNKLKYYAQQITFGGGLD